MLAEVAPNHDYHLLVVCLNTLALPGQAISQDRSVVVVLSMALQFVDRPRWPLD